ncbi:MAG: acetylxylan esterase [Chloroflexota bacterium]
MPYDNLLVYHGANPKPADFDKYWDRAIAEMQAKDHDMELIPAEFQTDFAESYHLESALIF